MKSDDVELLELRLLLEGVYERYGYDFRNYSTPSIRRRVRAAQSKLGAPHVAELTHRILTDPSVFCSLLPYLTVQVTEMFRDPPLHTAIRRALIPLLRTYPRLKIWHAGCATGEEVYAMAILLSEEGLYERTQIYGTDLDDSAIAKAREGIYTETQAELFSRNHSLAGGKGQLDDYCSSGYKHVSVKQSLRRNVVFFQHDLVSDHGLGEMNLIFCRNVALYFNERLRQRVFGTFAESLRAGGFLVLGRSECLPDSARQDFYAFLEQERVYRRGSGP